MYYDTKLCPTDTRVISFIKNKDIYVTSSFLREYARLTTTTNPTGKFGED